MTKTDNATTNLYDENLCLRMDLAVLKNMEKTERHFVWHIVHMYAPHVAELIDKIIREEPVFFEKHKDLIKTLEEDTGYILDGTIIDMGVNEDEKALIEAEEDAERLAEEYRATLNEIGGVFWEEPDEVSPALIIHNQRISKK